MGLGGVLWTVFLGVLILVVLVAAGMTMVDRFRPLRKRKESVRGELLAHEKRTGATHVRYPSIPDDMVKELASEEG